ncbi:OadG family protein [Aminipila sp.]|uniref:OadG family protein n=1 Tax=Aminipila sp. TaxID=2060095 RepID=UPI00289BBFE8|nr:OadG family protein [Aminipila sp.]
MDLSLMEKFANPALFDSLSTGEKATGALITTCMGMGITFIVLILLWAVIYVMAKIVAKAEGTFASKQSLSMAAQAKGQGYTEKSDTEDAELVAAITAAITAYEGNSGLSAGSFVVRRITRISGNAWGNAGRTECLDSRKF